MQRQGFESGLPARQPGVVELAELAGENAHGAAIGDDVVNGCVEDVLGIRQGHNLHLEERTVLEIPYLAPVLAGAVHLFAPPPAGAEGRNSRRESLRAQVG